MGEQSWPVLSVGLRLPKAFGLSISRVALLNHCEALTLLHGLHHAHVIELIVVGLHLVLIVILQLLVVALDVPHTTVASHLVVHIVFVALRLGHLVSHVRLASDLVSVGD